MTSLTHLRIPLVVVCIFACLTLSWSPPAHDGVRAQEPRKDQADYRGNAEEENAARQHVRAETAPAPPNNALLDCPWAGPDFPAPSQLSTSQPLQRAIDAFEAGLTSSGLKSNDTAFAVAMFSSKENATIYEHYYTPPINVGVREVNSNSVFRIGSLTKIFTLYAFLIAAGDEYFNDPITKYVPELATSGAPLSPSYGEDVLYDDIENVRWDQVTIGQLASHAAGIGRDATLGDASGLSPEVQAYLGLPVLDPEDIPRCGVNATTPGCSRDEMFKNLLKHAPSFPSGHSPVYTNIAYTLVGYALESITGQDLETIIRSRIFEPLGLTQSSYNRPIPNGVVAGDPTQVGWNFDLTLDDAAGGMYMSTADLVKAAQAILQSRLIPQAMTRRWLKPLIFTGDIGSSVGAPWEVKQVQLPNNRIMEYYNKLGDIGTYHSGLVFSPQHEAGWIVLVAGSPGSALSASKRLALMNVYKDSFTPAIEEQAKIEAAHAFDGTYVDAATNSSVRIVAGLDGRMGLAVQDLRLGGKPYDFLALLGYTESYRANVTALYPTTLKTVSRTASGEGEYVSRLGFRASMFPKIDPGKMVDASMYVWTVQGGFFHGHKSIDDWVFEIGEDGTATGVEIRMLRKKLKKAGESP